MNSQMKREIGRGLKQRDFCPPGAWGAASWHVEAFWFPNVKALQKRGQRAVLLGFYVRFITQSWLIQPLASLLSPEVKRVGLKVPTLGSHGWVSWWPAPILRCFPKSLHSYNKRHLYHSHHLENFKGFRNSVPETGKKVKYTFLVSHNMTQVRC